MDPKTQQIIQMLQMAQRLNIKDPGQLAKAQKICQVAKGLQGKPNLDPALNAELMRFFDSVGARPEVAGIKTTVQGNKWEQMNPPLPPLGKKR